MIGRIDIEKTLQIQPNKECLFVSVATVLNHVVDVVNGILDYAPLEMAMKAEPETPADPYAEQRGWIGKLCRFWDDNEKEWVIDFLRAVAYGYADTPYRGNKDWYEHCEPVKPDDDIIYKGGDNE